MNNISFDQRHKTFNRLHAHVINGIVMVYEYVTPINMIQAYCIDTSMEKSCDHLILYSLAEILVQYLLFFEYLRSDGTMHNLFEEENKIIMKWNSMQ